MHPLGPFAVCCYSVFKDHPGRLVLPDSRAAQGCDEVRNLTKSKQPVNNFLNPVILFTALSLPCCLPIVHIKCDAPGDRGKLLNQRLRVNGKNTETNTYALFIVFFSFIGAILFILYENCLLLAS